ncbi:LamG-like jellyroll fold domain-containing protein [Actinomadura rubrobrunea]|uniref:LamG-like jellyroll fold domain-containing protein n=1 Tax=Actinomadura rubrobrunea TaxID=115335 RepID=UPI0011B1F10D|nr:LamG-like jellyroll fold domain-containing protein [Actinomadura rubrobrunea]
MGLRFSGGGKGPLVRMSRAGRAMSLTWPGTLPEPVLDGDTAIYRGVLGPDVDLRLRALADGFTHTLVVKTAEAAKDPRLAKLAFKLGTSRLTVDQSASGLLTAQGTAGGPVFEAPAPVMWDSSQPQAPSPQARAAATRQDHAKGPGAGAKVAPVKVDLNDGELSLIPDRGLLTAPDTKFPVYIDPVWTTNKASSWAMVSSGYPNQSYYKFAGNATEGVGRCEVAKDSRCVKDQTKRIFFRMKLPSIKGRYIESAEFVAYETDAWDCDNPTSVQLWRTSALSSSATWNNTANAWNEHLTSRDVAYCSKTPVEFGGSALRSHVQSAVNNGYSTITFGLRAYSESSMSWWKRFADDAYLKIQYNRPPYQPDTETMFASPGTKCVDRPQAGWVNDVPTVYAYLKDPDTEDANKVQAQFTLHWADKADGSDWGPKWTSSLTPPLTSGSRHQIKLPTTIPQKKLIGWGVRAWDGVQWGPWSYDGAQTGCYFYYDPSIPAAPTISSTDYPDDQTWHGGVGEPGTFTISDPAKAAARYDIKLNGEPLPSVATTDGAARQITVTPTRSGPNILEAQAFTKAGQNGAPTTYEFWARTGAEAAARFGFDENPGTSEVTADTPGTAVHVRGGARLGGQGKVGTALTLDGSSGYAETDLPVIRTDQSFSVSAWVRLDATDPDKYYTVLSQEGVYKSAFFLRYDVGSRKWVFARPWTDSDVDDKAWSTAWSKNPAAFGVWTHLVGVYDHESRKMRIYVDGEPGIESNNQVEKVWHADGGLQIGRAKWLGWQLDHLPGAVDDVKVFQRALTDDEAHRLAEGTDPPVDGLKAHWSLDEDEGSSRAYSPVAPVKATFTGGASLGHPGQDRTALQLDGTTGYVSTDRPVVDTSRSFSVAAWVRVDSFDSGRHLSVLSQDGTYRSGFYLKYDPVQRKWVFTRFAEDSDQPDGLSFPSWSKETAQAGVWTHLAGVWDANTRRMRLFVNGVPSNYSAEVTSVWKATGGLQIGRSLWQGHKVDHFPGLIDDVRVYDRVLGATEVEQLVKQHPALKARWKLNADGSGEPEGAPSLALRNGATIDPGAGFYYGASSAGLRLDPVAGAFAETQAPVVNTDESFSVAGWVRSPGRPQSKATVFSQPGANTNAFVLRYVPGEDPEEQGDWQIEMNNADQQGTTPLVASSSVFEDDWNHVAIVYDGLRDRMRLYVNGRLEQVVAEKGQVTGFRAAGGGLQLGRNRFAGTGGGEFWPDAIDDVWVYQGALTETQVQTLSAYDELPTDAGP